MVVNHQTEDRTRLVDIHNRRCQEVEGYVCVCTYVPGNQRQKTAVLAKVKRKINVDGPDKNRNRNRSS